MSKVKALYHIVFATKERRNSIPPEHADDLYRFIWREVTDHQCSLVRIGGIENHIHILLDLHPSVALAPLVQDIKARSSSWMRSDSRFPRFDGWAAEYYACTVSPEGKDAIVEYIKSQPVHHAVTPFEIELQRIHLYASLPLHPRDLT